MRVCTSRQMAQIDLRTIAGGVPAQELMERAGEVLADRLLDFMAEQQASASESEHADGHRCGDGCGHDHEPAADVVLVCGSGNNGGDGLVMARLLEQEGLAVTVLLLSAAGALSPEAQRNLERLPAGVKVVSPRREEWATAFLDLAAGASAVVDAVLGTGARLPVAFELAELFRAMNDAAVPTMAVDIPSGVGGDDGQVDPVAVAVDLTVTIGLPKIGLLFPPGRDFAGEIEVVDIGFSDAICESETAPWHWLPRESYLALLPPRPSSCHKYECGRLALVAGSRAYGGAAHLAALGGLRSGVGLVTVAAPAGLEIPLRVGLPEVVLRVLPETAAGTIARPDVAVVHGLLERADAVAIGPGLGDDAETDRWVCELVEGLQTPMVVDADGLNAMARAAGTLEFAGRQVVLTPHAGEFAGLTGLTASEVVARRLELAATWADRWGAVVVLKGSPAVIGVPGEGAYVNASGDDALARGGTGDVLTGLIGGLLAQGLSARDAALLGTYVHGLAGTSAAEVVSNRGVLVREIAAAIGPVLLAMEREASASADLREVLWPTHRPEQGTDGRP